MTLTGVDVAELRVQRGWSRAELGRRTGLSGAKIWRIETKNAWKSGERERINDAFGLTTQISTAVEITDTQATPFTYSSDDGLIVVEPPHFYEVVLPDWGESGTVTFTVDVNDAVVIDAAPLVSESLEVRERPDQRALNEIMSRPLPGITVSPTELTARDGVRRYSNSEIQTFLDCPRRWYLTYFRGLRSASESPVGPRAIGDRIHRALARWYVPSDASPVDPRDAIEWLITADRNALTARYPGEYGVPEGLWKSFTRDADLERVMLEGYVDWVAETGCDAEFHVVQPEAYLEADVPGIANVKLIAKLDARVTRVTDGARLILETKTTGSFNDLETALRLDWQTIIQLYIERAQSDESTYAAGTLYNMLRRTKRTAKAQPPFYQRIFMSRNKHELTSFEQRIGSIINSIETVREALLDDERRARETLVYPRPTRDCSWKCSFFTVCGMFDDGSRADDALTGLFAVGDPYEYYLK